MAERKHRGENEASLVVTAAVDKKEKKRDDERGFTRQRAVAPDFSPTSCRPSRGGGRGGRAGPDRPTDRPRVAARKSVTGDGDLCHASGIAKAGGAGACVRVVWQWRGNQHQPARQHSNNSATSKRRRRHVQSLVPNPSIVPSLPPSPRGMRKKKKG